MTALYQDIASLKRMVVEIRQIRDRTCEPKSKENPRYHALSSAVSQLDRAIRDMYAESAPGGLDDRLHDRDPGSS